MLDNEQIEQVYRERRGKLMSHARGIVRSEEDAEDVLQNAFVNAIRKSHTFQERSLPSTWLYRITHNTALMHLRSKRRKGAESLDALSEDLQQVVVARAAELPDVEDEQIRHLDRTPLAARLEDAMSVLPELDRQIVRERLVEERSTEEVARSVGLSPSATKTRLHRARTRLRGRLAQPHLMQAAAAACAIFFFAACGAADIDPNAVPDDAVAKCEYVNGFSGAAECREYLGQDAWEIQVAEDNCRGQADSTFTANAGCDEEVRLGECLFEAGEEKIYRVVFPGDDSDSCESFRRGCEVFGGGLFIAAEPCGGLPDVEYDQGRGDGVYVQPEEICVETETGEEACTRSAIGACTVEGDSFADLDVCGDVRSQRGYYPLPGADDFVTASDDPILQDETFQEDLGWVKAQVEACGCVCCHAESATPSGASNWDVEADGVWTDTFRPSGLAMGAGWIDTSLLGAYPASENNGFDRTRTGLPTTDADRMVRFFESELTRRGYVEADFADVPPSPSIFLGQLEFSPEACEVGQGVAADGTVTWSGGDARYVYVLERDALNPLSPPNLDVPVGTRWLADVDWQDEPMASGSLRYGEVPSGVRQRVPESGAPASLESGTEYYLYVQADVVEPITRCLFVAP